jgi:outer membrane receptor protein involved in Fe transport
LEETFAGPPYSVPNLGLKAERNRAFEAGILQNLFGNKYAFTATYFNNLFYDRIDYASDPVTFIGQYVNVDKSFAQGAEIEFQVLHVQRRRIQSRQQAMRVRQYGDRSRCKEISQRGDA